MDNPETQAELGTINRAKTIKMKIRKNRTIKKKEKGKVNPGLNPRAHEWYKQFLLCYS